MIIDDETYHDTFIRSFITMVVPRGIQIQVLDTKAGIAYLRDYDGAGLVLLAKYPQTFYLLLEGGIELHEIIIGGMGARENRKVLYKNICASDEELDVLKTVSQRYIGENTNRSGRKRDSSGNAAVGQSWEWKNSHNVKEKNYETDCICKN